MQQNHYIKLITIFCFTGFIGLTAADNNNGYTVKATEALTKQMFGTNDIIDENVLGKAHEGTASPESVCAAIANKQITNSDTLVKVINKYNYGLKILQAIPDSDLLVEVVTKLLNNKEKSGIITDEVLVQLINAEKISRDALTKLVADKAMEAQRIAQLIKGDTKGNKINTKISAVLLERGSDLRSKLTPYLTAKEISDITISRPGTPQKQTRAWARG